MGIPANRILGFLEQASNRNQKHSDRKHYDIPKRDVAMESLADWLTGLLAREKVLKFGAGLVSRNHQLRLVHAPFMSMGLDSSVRSLMIMILTFRPIIRLP